MCKFVHVRVCVYVSFMCFTCSSVCRERDELQRRLDAMMLPKRSTAGTRLPDWSPSTKSPFRRSSQKDNESPCPVKMISPMRSSAAGVDVAGRIAAFQGGVTQQAKGEGGSSSANVRRRREQIKAEETKENAGGDKAMNKRGGPGGEENVEDVSPPKRTRISDVR